MIKQMKISNDLIDKESIELSIMSPYSLLCLRTLQFQGQLANKQTLNLLRFRLINVILLFVVVVVFLFVGKNT